MVAEWPQITQWKSGWLPFQRFSFHLCWLRLHMQLKAFSIWKHFLKSFEWASFRSLPRLTRHIGLYICHSECRPESIWMQTAFELPVKTMQKAKETWQKVCLKDIWGDCILAVIKHKPLNWTSAPFVMLFFGGAWRLDKQGALCCIHAVTNGISTQCPECADTFNVIHATVLSTTQKTQTHTKTHPHTRVKKNLASRNVWCSCSVCIYTHTYLHIHSWYIHADKFVSPAVMFNRTG